MQQAIITEENSHASPIFQCDCPWSLYLHHQGNYERYLSKHSYQIGKQRSCTIMLKLAYDQGLSLIRSFRPKPRNSRLHHRFWRTTPAATVQKARSPFKLLPDWIMFSTTGYNASCSALNSHFVQESNRYPTQQCIPTVNMSCYQGMNQFPWHIVLNCFWCQ